MQVFAILCGVMNVAGAASAQDSPAAKPAGPADGYRIQPGDILTVHVWREEELTGEVLVRPDGGLSAPLMGDLNAAGETVVHVAEQIQERLKRYIPDPNVTVAVKEIAGNRVYVVGKVMRAGDFMLNRPTDVMQALSMAGGMTPFASPDEIRILRRKGSQLAAIPFRYSEVERGKNLEQNVQLMPGDTVVVP
jgi:polysaccharide export outer membrane protein